jgi:serine protease Do
MGIGFAVPINMAVAVKDQLIAQGKVTRGFLGVQLNQTDMDDELAASFGLKRVSGVLVADVIRGAPAEKAGVKPGDVILEINGREIANNAAFRSVVSFLMPGSEAVLAVVRDGVRQTLKAQVGTFPGDDRAGGAGSIMLSTLGLTVENLNARIAAELGYEEGDGILVAEVEEGSPAAQAGILAGHLIVSVDRKPVRNLGELEQAFEQVPRSGRTLLQLRDPRYTWFVIVRF